MLTTETNRLCDLNRRRISTKFLPGNREESAMLFKCFGYVAHRIEFFDYETLISGILYTYIFPSMRITKQSLVTHTMIKHVQHICTSTVRLQYTSSKHFLININETGKYQHHFDDLLNILRWYDTYIWNFHHWLNWKLSKWQLPIQSRMIIACIYRFKKLWDWFQVLSLQLQRRLRNLGKIISFFLFDYICVIATTIIYMNFCTETWKCTLLINIFWWMTKGPALL